MFRWALEGSYLTDLLELYCFLGYVQHATTLTKFSTWIKIAMKNYVGTWMEIFVEELSSKVVLGILSNEVYMPVRSHRFIVFCCRRSYFFFFVTEASFVIVISLIFDEFFQCPWVVGIVLDIFPFFTSLRNETTSASNTSFSRLLSSNFFWSESSIHLCSSTSILRPWTCSSRVLEWIFSAFSSFIILIASLEKSYMVNHSSSLFDTSCLLCLAIKNTLSLASSSLSLSSSDDELSSLERKFLLNPFFFPYLLNFLKPLFPFEFPSLMFRHFAVKCRTSPQPKHINGGLPLNFPLPIYSFLVK